MIQITMTSGKSFTIQKSFEEVNEVIKNGKGIWIKSVDINGKLISIRKAGIESWTQA